MELFLLEGQDVNILKINDESLNFIVTIDEIGELYICLDCRNLTDEEYLKISTVASGTIFNISAANVMGFWKFSTKFRDSKLLPIKKIYLEKPDKNERIQRRNSVRIPYEEDINFAVIQEKNINSSNYKQVLEKYKNIKFTAAKAINISMGGLCFNTDQKIEKGQTVLIKLNLSDNTFELLAKIVRCNNNKNQYTTGLLFEDVGIQKNKFQKAITDLQRQRLKRSK